MLRSGSRFPALLPRGIRRVMSAECWIGIIRRFLARSSGMVARTGIGSMPRRGPGSKQHENNDYEPTLSGVDVGFRWAMGAVLPDCQTTNNPTRRGRDRSLVAGL